VMTAKTGLCKRLRPGAAYLTSGAASPNSPAVGEAPGLAGGNAETLTISGTAAFLSAKGLSHEVSLLDLFVLIFA
jgi:hypothetical protein